MPITSIRCPVMGDDVACVLDLEGNVTRVMCEEYEAAGGTCRLKQFALRGGPLSQLFERVSEHTLGVRGTACSLRPA